MKITKLGIIIFIFLLAVSLFPPMMGTTSIEDSATQSTGLSPDQSSITSNDLRSIPIDASITDAKRNITILRDARVVLEDEFQVKVLDNETQIATLNITIPSVFSQYIHQAKFFAQKGDDLGLLDLNNTRDYEVFYGTQFTTYFVNVEDNGFGLNETNGPLFVKTELTAVGALNVVGKGTGQEASFESPLVPMFNNIGYKDVTIGLGISTTLDEFDSQKMSRYTNRLDQSMPTFTDQRNVLTYRNMTRGAFSYTQDLGEQDVTTIVFSSTTPVEQTLQGQDLSVVVPTMIEKADRKVVFDPWGTVHVTETITYKHLGGDRNISSSILENIHQVPGYLYTVDSDAIVTDVYDEFGSLNPGLRDDGIPRTSGSSVDGYQDLQVNFRSAIYGGDSYTFSVEYKYNASQVVAKDTDTGVYSLNTTLFSYFNSSSVIGDLTTRIQFPAGSTIIGHDYQAKSRFLNYDVTTNVDRRSLSSFNHIELVFHGQNVSYVDNADIQIRFNLSMAGYFQYAASFFYVAIVLIAFAYALSNLKLKPSKAVEIEKEQIPVDEMDTFFNLFSEKAGAEKRIAELRKERRKGKLSKKDYDGKVKAIRRRLRDINPQLEKAAKELSAQGGRYDNYVKKVMLSSQKQADIRRNMRESKINYEKGNIPKNIYQIRIKEFNQELKKQEATINKTLTEMVETIQKYNQ